MRTTSLHVTTSFRKREPAYRRAPLAPVDGDRFGGIAADALLAELDTWPKPGLVSPLDNGSHDDMDYNTFLSSINVIRPYFAELAEAGGAGADMAELRRIGRLAEIAMLAATGGVNTHRGAIFALGLLCAAAGAACAERLPLSAVRLTRIVGERWGREIMRGPIPLNSHGSGALRRFGAGGARVEAASNFPHARTIGLPALRAGRVLTGDEGAARVHAFFALLAVMEDTNLLHRGGMEGLRDARRLARGFLLNGGVGRADWLVHAMVVHRAFVARRLSPGGSADLLAVTVFLDRVENAP
ncbi:triphosphoribosyl-dephospho-CoA synthase MdcB [Rhizobium etli]|uniref:Probable 2-(5''-triphosphoribosyl)-3'-dephosphocoenzyme-A synthase n=1 Tax=Rhizobium etli TaxID=29449 RepID=A0A7W6VFQ6_RHIET|nr:triphosphoribosyl-dephospho-CoA synthase MdcB [Rhizobium etli]MBB4483407.1 triphosphoribosyl-dephospho-CoA synthase [Rhizobium etli]MBB4539234.1 triphosphoribosyl-dephospho-CoA synthase [Rhizobium etli]